VWRWEHSADLEVATQLCGRILQGLAPLLDLRGAPIVKRLPVSASLHKTIWILCVGSVVSS
jgi:hypothetical protein